MVKGVKRTLPATPPERLYVLPEVIRNAPLKLRQAGFCDVLAKVVSDIDWQAGIAAVQSKLLRFAGRP